MERKTRSGKVVTTPPPAPPPGKVMLIKLSDLVNDLTSYLDFRKGAGRKNQNFRKILLLNQLLQFRTLEEVHEEEVSI